MKTLLSILTCFILLFVGCQEQVNNSEEIDFSSLTIQELADVISKDTVYLDLQQQTKKHFDDIKMMMKENKTPAAFKTLSKKEVLDQLGLNEEYWEKREAIMIKKVDYLNNKFKLNERPEEEVKTLFKVLYQNSFSQKSLSKGGNCQAQFEADIASAHATYDFMIYYGCTVLALRTGPGGYAACAVGSVFNATLAVAEAIDAYNACME